MEKYSSFSLRFRNIRYNTYTLYKKTSLFSGDKFYMQASDNYGYKKELEQIKNDNFWDRIYYSGLFLKRHEKRLLAEDEFKYMNSDEFLEKLKFLKGAEMNYFLYRSLDSCGYPKPDMSISATKDYNMLMRHSFNYKGERWKFIAAYFENDKPEVYSNPDHITIYIENIESGKRETIVFNSLWFQRSFLCYWALYLIDQFRSVAGSYQFVGDIGIFDLFRDPFPYYKWLDYKDGLKGFYNVD